MELRWPANFVGVGLKMFKFKWGAAVGGGLPRYRIGKVLNPPHGARNSAASCLRSRKKRVGAAAPVRNGWLTASGLRVNGANGYAGVRARRPCCTAAATVTVNQNGRFTLGVCRICKMQ